MDKKYQVFVSSTYEDLKEERRVVMQALLELDCIPAGMELFPAANEDQWSLIKKVIDQCDYYILIIGVRYGSICAEGISFTEMEYQYALETNKPTITFIHKDHSLLPIQKKENSIDQTDRFNNFIELVQKKLCKYWSSSEELGAVVSRSLIKLQQDHPGAGWVRGTCDVSQKGSKINNIKWNKSISQYKNKKSVSIRVKPKVVIFSGPYGAGKDTVLYLLAHRKYLSRNEKIVITKYTDRKPRKRESSYYKNVTPEEFNLLIKRGEIVFDYTARGKKYGFSMESIQMFSQSTGISFIIFTDVTKIVQFCAFLNSQNIETTTILLNAKFEDLYHRNMQRNGVDPEILDKNIKSINGEISYINSNPREIDRIYDYIFDNGNDTKLNELIRKLLLVTDC